MATTTPSNSKSGGVASVDMVLILDVAPGSSSLPLVRALQQTKGLEPALDPAAVARTRVGIIAVDDYPVPLAVVSDLSEPAAAFTASFAALAVPNPTPASDAKEQQPSTRRAYEIALREARTRMGWRQESAAKVVVVVGDGLPREASYTTEAVWWKDEADSLAKAGITVVALHPADSLPHTVAFLGELARRTLGSCVAVEPSPQLWEVVFAAAEAMLPQPQRPLTDVRVDRLRGSGALAPWLESAIRTVGMCSTTAHGGHLPEATFGSKEGWWDRQSDNGSPRYSHTGGGAWGPARAALTSTGVPRMSKIFNKTKPSDVRICLLGSKAVGKTALGLRFATNTFTEQYTPTIDDSYRKTVTIEGSTTVNVEVIDTASQGEYALKRPEFVVLSHGFAAVFSVVDRESFEKVRDYCREVITLKADAETPCVLVGTKVDLPNRTVTEEEGMALAKSFDLPYFETSALSNHNVDRLFTALIGAVVIRRGLLVSMSARRTASTRNISSRQQQQETDHRRKSSAEAPAAIRAVTATEAMATAQSPAIIEVEKKHDN